MDIGEDPEMVDLVDDLPSLSYENLSPSDYHSESSVRLPKQKPKFSYASGEQANLSFLNIAGPNDDPFDFEDGSYEDFPSPSALLNMEGTSYHLESGAKDTIPIPPGFFESPEAAVSGFDDPTEPITPAPVINSSFENGVFDFSAFDDEPGEQGVFSSPLMQPSLKRPRPPTPDLVQLRCSRVKRGEMLNGEEMSTQEEGKLLKEESIQHRSTPAWVDEFDQDLIHDLRGIVDFVD